MKKKNFNLKNIESLEQRYCNGCECCAQICPKSAISMVEDENGFFYPSVDKSKCNHCGLCVKRCSNQNNKFNPKQKHVYAFNGSDEIRAESSSGGAFTVIAEYILANNGVVCGAAYDYDFSVKHIIVDNIDDLGTLRTSKYMQSRIGNIFLKIKELLLNGRFVLFVGTPCQVSGLLQFLDGIDARRLVTVDLICSGVPSYKLFKTYLSQYVDVSNVESVNFRDKKFGWGCDYNIKITLKTGEVFEQLSKDCEYMTSFLSGLSIRESCNVCKFAKDQRCSDITLGDLWGITNICDDVYDKKGTSLVIFNKFTELTNEIKGYLLTKCNCLKKLRFSKKVVYYNQRLAYPAFCNPSRTGFLSDINRIPFKEATEINLTPKYHVAILNYWWGNNYGSNLTAYALQRMVAILGYTSCLVGFTYDSIENFYRGISDNFSRKYLITTSLLSEESLSKLNDQTDRFIVGSDQVFRNKYMHDSFFLNFVHLNKLKVAYSASFGKKHFKCRTRYLNAYKYLLSRFDYVSVREYSGTSACAELGAKGAIHIIDPVFTIDESEYIDIARGSSLSFKEKYLLVYILDLTKPLADKCKSIAKKMNLDCKFIRVGKDSVEDWLNLYINASYIITDSFHGTCFSIIFNKNFICIENLMRGEERFRGIKDSLNLPPSCFVDETSFITHSVRLDNNINYQEISSTIDKLNKCAWDFLKKVLTCPLPSYSEKDLKDDELKLSNTITPKCTKGKFTIKYFACFDSLLSKENGIAELSIYGAGEICQYLIKYCDYRGIKINQIFDSYPELKNNCIMGRKISRLSEHNLKNGDSLFVASVEFKDQIVGFVKDNIKDLDLKIITLNL